MHDDEETTQPDNQPDDTNQKTDADVAPYLTFENKGATFYSVTDGIAAIY